MRKKPIYVETSLDASMDLVWEYTQNPKKHEKWDVRFTKIEYLPTNKDEPQRFFYKTNIGFGMSVSGYGETVSGNLKGSDNRVSSLTFGTDHPLSIIKKGRGYWKYIETAEGITFLTQYDYETNYGPIGNVIDRLMFRPLLGWATAWSFDALKLWLEKGFHPQQLFRQFLTYWISSVVIAFVWIYHGLVPKLLAVHPKETEMLGSLIPGIPVHPVVQVIGICEILFGLLWLLPIKRKKWFLIHIILLCLLTAAAAKADMSIFINPFNPASLHAALIGISIIGWNSAKNLPRAGNAKRKKG
jgi:hypothetical protein